ncbi:MAG: hypothetical protein Q9160_005557 [Pyrenula sp. 1 TL-2023]
MAFHPPHDSELDSILNSLSQFTPQQASQQIPQQAFKPTAQQAPPIPQHPKLVPHHHLGLPAPGDPRSRSATPTSKAAPPRPSSTALADPSTITEWRAAQKYVTFTVAQNEATVARIKRLIKKQHDHERQWWEGRKALVTKQSGRVEGKKAVDDLLKAMGGNVGALTATHSSSTTDENAEELRKYDGKIYKALTEMARAIDGELRGMSVPFFAIKHDLVMLDNGNQYAVKKGDGGKDIRLSRGELQELQKRMLQLLEDLFAG